MSSPFKFLDSYNENDRKVFFGREQEIADLYRLVFETRLLLVYGASGTGKTSLIQCGLANCFKPSDWFPVFVRRKEDLNVSLDREVRRLAPTPIKDGANTTRAVQSLYLDHLRPVYLIFDQFEELFILGSPEEQAIFFASIKALLESDVAAKIIISMREEYLAMLHDFEKVVPNLFDKRLRIEPMSMRNIEAVITGTTADLGIGLDNGDATARAIIDNLSDGRSGVQLAYLQVYLDKLYREAAPGPPVVFTDALVAETGKLGDVMADFVEEQTGVIQTAIAALLPATPPDAIQRLLEAFTTLEGTKQPRRRAELAELMPGLAPVLPAALAAIETARLIRDDDGVLELAHDTLAGRIAERRSTEAKALLRIQKLVRDRLAAYDQTQTWLNAEELALARPHLAELGLSEPERRFVAGSTAKLRRRRQWIAAGTASVIAVLAGFGLFAYKGQLRANEAISIASDATNDLALVIFEELRPLPRTEAIRLKLLRMVGDVDRKLTEGGGPVNSAAPFWTEILKGDMRLERRKPGEAIGNFNTAKRAADDMATRFPEDPSWPRNQSVALSRQGTALLAAGDEVSARQRLTAALAIDETRAKARKGDADAQHDLWVSLGALGAAEAKLGHLDAASTLYARAIPIARQLDLWKHDADSKRDLAASFGQFADIAALRQEFAAAQDHYAKAIAIFVALHADDPERAEWLSGLATGHFNLGEVALNRKDIDSAVRASDAALGHGAALLDLEPGNLAHQATLADLHRQRSVIELQRDDTGAAREAALQSVILARRLVRANPTVADRHSALGSSHRQLATAELARCAFAPARVAAEMAVRETLSAGSGRDDDPATAFDLYSIHEARAEIERHAGDFAAASAATGQALSIARKLEKTFPDDPQLIDDLKRLEETKASLARRVAIPPPSGCKR